MTRSARPRTTASRRASIVGISDANDSSNDFTPSSVSLSVIASRLKPFSSNLRSTSARFVDVLLERQRARVPWSLNASYVAGGTVLTVSAPISDSM